MVTSKGLQRAHLLDRKAEVATAPDERQALDVAFAVHALATFLPGGSREEPDGLVVADGWDVGPGSFRQGADSHGSQKGLEPQVT